MDDDPALLCCSPHAGGASDLAGALFARAAREAGSPVATHFVRELGVVACLGCGACARGPAHACPLSDGDRAEDWFRIMRQAPFVAFAAPIYFYHAPAMFKALIDRSQRHYELAASDAAGTRDLPRRPAYVLLVAGRKTGERLFEGLLLTLKYFLAPFGLEMAEPLCLRGLDRAEDLGNDARARAAIADYALGAIRAAGVVGMSGVAGATGAAGTIGTAGAAGEA